MLSSTPEIQLQSHGSKEPLWRRGHEIGGFGICCGDRVGVFRYRTVHVHLSYRASLCRRWRPGELDQPSARTESSLKDKHHVLILPYPNQQSQSRLRLYSQYDPHCEVDQLISEAETCTRQFMYTYFDARRPSFSSLRGSCILRNHETRFRLLFGCCRSSTYFLLNFALFASCFVVNWPSSSYKGEFCILPSVHH